MPSSEDPEKLLRWRLVVGDRPGLRYRRWPTAMLGSGLTEVPEHGAPARRNPPSAGSGDRWAGSGDRWAGSGDHWAGAWDGVLVARMAVVAQSVSWLRHLLDHPAALAGVRRVSLVVDDWRIPQRGWSGRLGPLPHLLTHRVRMPARDQGRVLIDVELRRPVPLRSVLAAVLPLLTPVRPLPASASAEVTARDVLPDWLGGGPNLAAVAGDLPSSDDIRPHDLVLTPTGEPRPTPEREPQPTPDREPRPTPGGEPRSTPGGEPRPTWVGEQRRSPYRDGRSAPGVPGPRVVVPADTGAGPLYRAMLAAQPGGAGSEPGRGTVLVDLEHAPIAGRYGPFGPAAGRAELTVAGPDGRDWHLAGPGGIGWRGQLDPPWLTDGTRAALAEIGVVVGRALPGRHPMAEAALLVHLILAGVLVHVPDLPPACRAHLAGEVVKLITEPLPDRPASELDWEIRAVRQRRAAMRRHARGIALPRLVAGDFPALAEVPSVTALLVTRRLEHVLDAVAAVEAQTYPEVEIVLCLHGVRLPAGLRSRLAGCTRPLEILHVPLGHSFGEAIGLATGRARGSLLAKFDDDDTYGPEHVWDLVLARHHSGAVMVGKAAEFVYLRALDTTVRRESGPAEEFGSLIAGGTMLISRGDLEQVGGWRPVPRSIDRGLIDRVRRAGGLIYRTHPLGYVYQRHSAGHTWDQGLEYFLRGGGMQWSGLPRHSEFGTLGPAGPRRGAAGPPGTGGVDWSVLNRR